MQRVVPWVPAAVWAAVLFFVSAQPTLAVDLSNGRDKIAHFFAYLVLGFLLARATAKLRWPLWVAIVVGLAYGILDELHQSTVPGRSVELGDWVADALGTVVGAMLFLAIRRRRTASTAPAESTST